MAFVVRLEGYTPGQRDDAPWTQAQIWEGPTREGPWTLIDTQALTPVDADPLDPASRDFTITTAVNAQDWFRVIFLDALGNQQIAPPVYFPNPAMKPTVADVGRELWARTKDAGGNTTGVFNATTRPTATQVEEFIDSAVNEVVGRTGTIPERLWGMAREAATIRAAMIVERSFRPEQANDAESAYTLLRQEWLDLMGGGASGQTGTLIEAMADSPVGASAMQSVRMRSVMTDPEALYSDPFIDALDQVANLNEI